MPTLRDLNDAPPAIWHGRTSGATSHDLARWPQLDAGVRRWLDALPLEPPPDPGLFHSEKERPSPYPLPGGEGLWEDPLPAGEGGRRPGEGLVFDLPRRMKQPCRGVRLSGR